MTLVDFTGARFSGAPWDWCGPGALPVATGMAKVAESTFFRRRARPGCHRLTLAFAPILLAVGVLFREERRLARISRGAAQMHPGSASIPGLSAAGQGGSCDPGETLPADAASALRGFLAAGCRDRPGGGAGWGIPLFIMLLGIIVAAALWRQTGCVLLGCGGFGCFWRPRPESASCLHRSGPRRVPGARQSRSNIWAEPGTGRFPSDAPVC